MDHHTEEAYRRREQQRKVTPWSVARPAVFYHVACMNHWRLVVDEQMRLLAHVGLTGRVNCCMVGAEHEDVGRCIATARLHGIALNVLVMHRDLCAYENPTLHEIWKFARSDPNSAVLYLHTKGVSCPPGHHEYFSKQQRRRLMHKHLLADWRKNLAMLSVNDAVGVGWMDLPDFPHYCGNFWLARTEWLASLSDPEVYRRSRPGFRWAENPWERMNCELWLGSAPWHKIESLFCRHLALGDIGKTFTADVSIEGIGTL